MKKFFTLFLFTVLFIAGSYEKGHCEPVKLAIAPFGVESETGIDFMSKGIIDLFSSRLAFPGKVTVIDKATVINSIQTSEKVTTGIARDIGKKNNADYVLFGFILESDQEVAVKAYVLDVHSDKEPIEFTARSGKYENSDLLLPFVNRLSAKINSKIFSRGIIGEPNVEAPTEAYNVHTHPDNLLKDLNEEKQTK